MKRNFTRSGNFFIIPPFIKGAVVLLAFTLLFPLLSLGQHTITKPNGFYSRVKAEDYIFYHGDSLTGFDLKGNFEKAKAMNCSSNELHNYMMQAEQVFLYAKYRIALRNPHHADAMRSVSRNGESVEPSEDDQARGIKTIKDIWLDNTGKHQSHQAFGAGCNNIDFSDPAPYTNWSGAIGVNNWAGAGSVFTSWGNWQYNTATLNTQNTTPPPSGTPITLGKDANLNSCSWLTICTKGTDSCGNFPMVCPGFTASCRLGGDFVNLDPGIGGGFAGCGERGSYALDAGTGLDTSSGTSALVGGAATGGHHQFAAQGEEMEQAIPITSGNDLLTINFAAVLNDGGHPSGEQPFVFFAVYDQSGNPISCLQYYQEAVAGTFPTGFLAGKSINWIQNTAGNGGGEYQTACYYKPWSSIAFDMSAYVGTTVTFQAIACGCWQGGHFAYCYIDLSCGKVQLPVVSPVCGSTTITAPSGGATYKWTGPCISGSSTNQTVKVTCSGTYSCTINLTGTAGCNFTIDTAITVTSNPTPTITASPSASICTGGSGTTLSATGAGAGGTYTWSTGVTASSISVNPLVTTTYTVTASTSPFVCSGTKTIVVTVNTTPTITVSATPSSTICSGSSVTLNTSGGTGATTYIWSTGATTTSITVSPGTTTTYTVTPTNGACGGTPQTIVITVNPTPTINVTAAPPTICSGGSTTVTANGGTGGTTYVWSTGATTSSITVSPGTTTTYTVTSTNGTCSTGPKTIIVTVNTTPTITVSATPGTTICSGNTVTLNANGGSGGTTYAWTGGTFPTTGATVFATPGSTTTYTVVASNGACAGAAQTITITVNPTPTVTASATPSATICSGSSVKLNASPTGLASYTWTPAATLTTTTYDTTTASPTVTTTYTVKATTAAGCSNTTPATVVVTVNASPTVSIGALPSTAICSGTTVILTASGATTYLWNSGATTSIISVSPITTTTYTVTGTNAAGCSNGNATKTIVITVTTTPTVVVNPASPGLCPGDTAKITASGATTYLWSGGQTTDTIMAHPGSTTTYTVTGTNGTCTDQKTVTVTVGVIKVTASASSPAICAGQLDTIKASGAASYIWNNGSTNSSFVITATNDTSFSVKGTSGSGCSDSAKVSILVSKPATITASSVSPGTVCPGDTTQAYVTVTGAGNPPYTYNWSTTPAQTTDTAMGLGAGTYTVAISDASHCISDTASVTITTKNIVVTAFAAPPTICSGDSTTLTATGATNYMWSNGSTSSAIKVGPATDSTYQVIGTTTGKCKDSNTVTVIVSTKPLVNVSASDTAICTGQSTVITAIGATSYTWTPTAGLSPTSGSPVTASPAGTTTYSVIGANAAGCVDTATIIITVNASPTVSISITGGNDTICPGTSVTLTASGGVTYSWSPGGSTSAAVNVSPVTSPTTYTVTAYSANGACTDTKSQPIYLFPPLVLNMATLDSVCSGQAVIIDATVSGGDPLHGYTYVWTPALGTGSGPYVVNPISPTTYSCTVTDGCNNTATSTTQVAIYPTPVAIFTAAPNPVLAGEYVAFVDSSTLATAWYWTFGDGGTSTAPFPYYQYNVAGNYITTLWVTNKSGCRDSAIDTIHVIELIYVPNVFTPNNDGTNDVFHVTASSLKTYNIEIFNRWGQRVFMADSPNVDWDGRSMSGVEESDGTYYYIIKATDYSSKNYNLNGYLQLIR